MRETLTNDFLGLHKNKNWAFPLKSFSAVFQDSIFKNGTSPRTLFKNFAYGL